MTTLAVLELTTASLAWTTPLVLATSRLTATLAPMLPLMRRYANCSIIFKHVDHTDNFSSPSTFVARSSSSSLLTTRQALHPPRQSATSTPTNMHTAILMPDARLQRKNPPGKHSRSAPQLRVPSFPPCPARPPTLPRTHPTVNLL